MNKNRLEAFSDGVLAIIITIMVLELKVPHGVEWSSLRPVIPTLLSYVLSFIYIGIYWNNHHHMLQLAHRVNGTILWANLHLLFWLSLIPFVTGWMGENHFATVPVALYGFNLLMAAIAYYILQTAIVKYHGKNSKFAHALGSDIKGKISPVLYVLSVPLAYVNPLLSGALFVLVALIWLIPDKRMERAVLDKEEHP